MIWRQLSLSCVIKAAVSSGELPTGTTERSLRRRTTSGCFSASETAEEIFAASAAGRPARLTHADRGEHLFVDPAARRGGVGRRLIEAVAAAARERGCRRLYWTTKEDNAAARSLYDRIARFNGFIRYDYPLE